jgi:ABC-type multidrug transport system ATPase subunit
MVVGPMKALFMDEISNGLDSSTTFQIVSCMQHLAHITDATVLISLLQPAPEIFDLFDDIMLMAEGMVVYHGPRSSVCRFFEDSGFRCPERKEVADFLQEVSLYASGLSLIITITKKKPSFNNSNLCRLSLEKIKGSIGTAQNNLTVMFL